MPGDLDPRVTTMPPWPATAEQALAQQEELRRLVDAADHGPADPATVAGADIAYHTESDVIVAAVVVLDGGSLKPVDSATTVSRVAFPYVPGLLAYRELPALLTALDQLRTTPQLVVCDGYGLAHPRRFGLACHLGVVTGLPTIGVGKTPFVGSYGPLGELRGDGADLVDDGEVVGRALRTRDGVRPVYVSVGHRVSLDTACRLVLRFAPRYRQPEPIRAADHLARATLAAYTSI